MGAKPPVREWQHGADAARILDGRVRVIGSAAWMILSDPRSGDVMVGLQLDGLVYVMPPEGLESMLAGMDVVRGDLERIAAGLPLDDVDA